MATLPDLDPDTTGFLAFWNVIEQGGLPESELDWSDVLDHPNVNSYDLYDNGAIIDYDDAAWPSMTVRLKTDGWMVAYNDTTEGYDGTIQDEEHEYNDGNSVTDHPLPAGPCNLSLWWDETFGTPPNASIEQNRFAVAINQLQADLPESGEIAFNYADVGFYDFINGAGSVSLFSQGLQTDASDLTRDINLLSGTTVHACHLLGKCEGSNDTGWTEVTVNGNQIARAGEGTNGFGSRDHTSYFVNDGTVTIGLSTGDATACGASGIITWSEAQ